MEKKETKTSLPISTLTIKKSNTKKYNHTKKKVMSNPTKKNKGGLRITNVYNEHTAINYFLENSNFSILNSQNMSCIPIIATLVEDESIIRNSPYRTVRSNYMNSPVKRILFKIFLCGNKESVIIDKRLRNDYINITPIHSIKKEIEIQEKLLQFKIEVEMD